MRNSIPLLLSACFLVSIAQAGAIFERNSLSLQNLSDIPLPIPPSGTAFAGDAIVNPPAPSAAFPGAPEVPGPGGEVGGGDGERGSDPNRGDGGDAGSGQDGAGRGGRSDQERSRESGTREGREQEAQEREQRSGNDRARENNDREAREREAQKNQQKGNKQKSPARGTDSKPTPNGKGGFRERSGDNSNFKEVARLAEANSGSVSDLPAKYVNARTYEAPLPYWPIAATTIGTPSAHGADWTDVFAGVGVQNRGRYGTLPNSTAIVGLGFGDARRNMGLEVGISSFGLLRHGLPFTTGGVSLKLHHYFTDWGLGVAAGYENAIYWGSPDSGQSFFLVFSKYFMLGKGSKHEPFRTLFVHFGLGDGRFRTESEVVAGRNSISPFMAVALRVADPVNMIANWTGSDLSLGVSLTPFRTFPFSVGLSALDVLRAAGDGVRFSMVVSYGDSTQNPSFPVNWFRSEQRSTYR